MTISERLKDLLDKRGYGARKEMSQYIGVGQSTLNNWLTLNRSIPAEYIVGMAEYLGVSIAYLLIGQEEIKSDFSAVDIHGQPISLSAQDQEMLKLKANAALTARIQEIVAAELEKHQD